MMAHGNVRSGHESRQGRIGKHGQWECDYTALDIWSLTLGGVYQQRRLVVRQFFKTIIAILEYDIV
jgi:hypothetical protein